MKKLFILIFLTSFSLVSYNQVIKGTIYDSKTKETIYSASVYFNGTSVGTLSDQKGNFVIDISKYASMPLTISAVGYYSYSIKDISTSKPLLIYLNPKVFELNEVAVSAKFHSLQRMENLTIFRNEFLGTTANAMNCEITNEDDIIFKSSADKDTLRAYSTKPLLIDNKALGYKITYYLDKFEYNKESKSFFFSGNVIFTEDSTIMGRKKAYIEKKRKDAYLGSRMHFLRSLWLNNLNDNGYTVRNSANEIVGYDKIVYTLNSRTKYLSTMTNLGVAYYTKNTTSYILPVKDKVFFDANGYYDQLLLSWEGEMSRQRVADQLPYEYH